jgi:AraC-like DNA-binding protein
MPSLHLMINFGDAFQIYDPSHLKPLATCAESWLVGMWNTYHLMDVPQDLQVLNVSFKPGGAYPFLQLPLSDLHNQIVSLDAILGSFSAEIRERLYAAPSMEARLALLERLLLARLCEAPQGLNMLNVVRYSVAQIARHHGMLSIGALSDLIGISQKHLITQFKRLVGGTPKELARLYRFRHALQSIDPTQSVDWTLVARRSRYYDQSHFDKDFRAFTGHSPTEYLPLRRQIYVQSSESARLITHLPTG